MNESSVSAMKFSKAQAEYLLANVELAPEVVTALRSADRSVQLSASQRKALLDQVASRLQTKGFDRDYKPTEEGRLLESVIDILRA
jgi:chitinase